MEKFYKQECVLECVLCVYVCAHEGETRGGPQISLQVLKETRSPSFPEIPQVDYLQVSGFFISQWSEHSL
jgi:hypothetical protein